MKIITLATTNPHKQQELIEILHEILDLGKKEIFVRTLAELSEEIRSQYNPQEIYPTLMQNAYAKAQNLYRLVRSPVLAEDSGLFVEALQGRPGVLSARYAASDEEKIVKLLAELRGLKNRRAVFATTLCFFDEHGHAIFFNGRIQGNIAEEAMGVGGFGYDPVFIPDGSSLSYAQMSKDKKNQISQRRRALELFGNYLKKFLQY
ncbi:MAG: RdgB/HAM1 family non-canonical purine NTP pyrophosphatase [Leptospiraceae bacterium]|nr:RdgB/HAM1 family non-canonical purine NTP pyrophosphatase [Leptospiraceae bacterium]MDW8305695.1 RdgB/HAM1 family non-canonical purine NTP pyrophosphatase [Leptospiraceae bacterium]